MILFPILLALPALALDLAFDGDCPGPMRVTISDLTPDARVGLAFATDAGEDTIGTGPCAGTPTGLADATFAFTVADRDGDGTVTFAPEMPPSACDRLVQVVDLASCAVSAPTPVVGAGGVIYAADGRGTTGSLYTVDPDTGAIRATVPLAECITGLAYDTSTGVLYGVSCTSNIGRTGEVYRIDPDSGAMESVFYSDVLSDKRGIAAAGGRVYGTGESGRWGVFDADGVELASGSDPVVFTGKGADGAAAADGTIWFVNGASAYVFDGDGLVPQWEDVPDAFASGNGGGATFHEGALVLSEANDHGGTDLWLDDGTGSKSPLGITIDARWIDAIVSTTP